MQRTTTKTLAALSIFALAAVGLAATVSAQDDPTTPEDESTGIYKWWGKHLRATHFIAHQFAQCDNNITVGECKEQIQGAGYEKCLEEHDQEFCDERRAEFEERRAQREAAVASGEAPPHGGFGGPRGPGGPNGPGGPGGPGPQPDGSEGDAPESE